MLIPTARRLRSLLLRLLGRQRVFTHIYRSNGWGSADSKSGLGSTLAQTATIREALPQLLDELAVTSLLDAPCGDFHWMQSVDLGSRAYMGVDIVPALIEQNRARFAGPNRTFESRDLVRDALPACDLVLCRDCLVHLPFADALAVLRNFKASGARYLLTTTFDERERNADIAPGEWRPLNLQSAPFRFPAPLRSIDERCAENGGVYADKRLALWRFGDLPL